MNLRSQQEMERMSYQDDRALKFLEDRSLQIALLCRQLSSPRSMIRSRLATGWLASRWLGDRCCFRGRKASVNR